MGFERETDEMNGFYREKLGGNRQQRIKSPIFPGAKMDWLLFVVRPGFRLFLCSIIYRFKQVNQISGAKDKNDESKGQATQYSDEHVEENSGRPPSKIIGKLDHALLLGETGGCSESFAIFISRTIFPKSQYFVLPTEQRETTSNRSVAMR
jgi:hypothetical protein